MNFYDLSEDIYKNLLLEAPSPVILTGANFITGHEAIKISIVAANFILHFDLYEWFIALRLVLWRYLKIKYCSIWECFILTRARSFRPRKYSFRMAAVWWKRYLTAEEMDYFVNMSDNESEGEDLRKCVKLTKWKIYVRIRVQTTMIRTQVNVPVMLCTESGFFGDNFFTFSW